MTNPYRKKIQITSQTTHLLRVPPPTNLFVTAIFLTSINSLLTTEKVFCKHRTKRPPTSKGGKVTIAFCPPKEARYSTAIDTKFNNNFLLFCHTNKNIAENGIH